MIWNPGDDTDLNEGGDGIDTVEVNGGNGSEVFTVTANGTRVRFDRVNPAPFSLDIGTSENLVVNMNGGDDTFSATGNLAALIQITVDGGDRQRHDPRQQRRRHAARRRRRRLHRRQPGQRRRLPGRRRRHLPVGPGRRQRHRRGSGRLRHAALQRREHRREYRHLGQRRPRAVHPQRRQHHDGPQRRRGDRLQRPAAGPTLIAVNNLRRHRRDRVQHRPGAATPAATGDGEADAVIVNGTNLGDVISVPGSGGTFTRGRPAGAGDRRPRGGDQRRAHRQRPRRQRPHEREYPARRGRPADVDAGAGNDTIVGSQGADCCWAATATTSSTATRAATSPSSAPADDVFKWDPGDGSDIVEGQDGTDTLLFFGSNASENIDVSANGGRVRLSRDVGNVTMDLNDVERSTSAPAAGPTPSPSTT